METFEKKYNEALERARKGMPIDEVFPELKENEDERIRKALIRFFKHTHNWVNLKYDGDEIVAYLEKQKDSPMPEDTVIFQKGVAEGRRLEREEQRPAEWSEEDKTMLERCISKMANIIPVPGKHGLTNMSFEKHTDEKLAAWLKFLPERFNPQPKQEWSKEDEKTFELLHTCVCRCINDDRFDYAEREQISRRLIPFIERLKSLRPQLHWKPSEEQMRCLLDCVSKAKEIHNASVGGYDAYRILVSLYNDLTKL